MKIESDATTAQIKASNKQIGTVICGPCHINNAVFDRCFADEHRDRN